MAETRATTPREWAIALAGGLALATVLVLWLRPPAPAGSPPAATRGPAPAITPPLAPAAPSAASPSGPPQFILRGVLARAGGGSAILEDDSGSQRLVGLGRVVAPGWRLAALDAGSATLEASDGSRVRLDFEPGQTAESTGAEPLELPAITERVRVEDLAATSTAYRLALKPIAGDTEITGWTVQSPETVPLLRLAGLRPGDILLAVNGQPLFSEEKIIELPEEISSAREIELTVMRGGQKATVRFDLAR